MCSRWHIVISSNGGLRYRLDKRARFPGLGDGQRPGPLRQEWTCDACKDEASQNRYWQGILGDPFVPYALGKTKDNVLHLVIHPATSLERLSLGIRGEIV